MANTLYDMSVVLRLDSSEFEQGLNMVDAQTQGFGGKLSKIGTIAKVAFGAMTAAGTAFAVSSVKTGMSFDSSMSRVAATMGKTMEEMQTEVGSVDLAWGSFSGNLREYAQEMGRHTAFTATQAADALNYMALAGYNAQESMDMLPNVLNLAAAGGMDLARASDMVTDSATAFGMVLEDGSIDISRANQMVNEMAKAASTGNTSVEQLGDAFLVVGGLARELNGGMVTLKDGTTASVDGITEMEIALTAMANAGVKGSEAGTHMRNMIMKLSSPTAEGTKQLEALGVSVFDAEGKMRSLSDIFGDLDGALGQLTQQEKLQAISDLFNARDLASAEALLSAVGQDWDEIGESILQAQGSAQKMADTQLDNLTGDMTLFTSALEGAKIALSDKLQPALRNFVQFGTKFAEVLTSVFEGESIGSAISRLGNSILEQFGPMANAALEAGIKFVSKLGEGFIEGIPAFLEQFLPFMESFTGNLRENAGRLVDVGLEFILNLAQGIINSFPLLLEQLPQIVINIAGVINDNAPKLLVAGITLIKNIIVGIVQSIPALIQNFPQIFKAILSVWTAMNWTALGKNAITFIKNGIAALRTAIPQALKNIGQQALDWFRLINWQTLGADIIGLIQIGIQSLASAIPNALRAIGQTAMSAFKDINWGQLGINIIRGIAAGITGAAGVIVSAAKNAAKSAFDAAKNFLGIKSPSKLFRDQIGANIGKGLALGIEDTIPAVTNAIDDMADELSDFDDLGYSSSVVTSTSDKDRRNSSDDIIGLLRELIGAIADLDDGLYDKFAGAFEAMSFSINGREFGRMVRDVRTT